MGRPKTVKPTSKTTDTTKPSTNDKTNGGLDALLAFEEALGDDTSAFKRKKTDVNIISTGSPQLNDLCVVGGLPRGRIVQFYGPFGGGKTFLAMLATKNVLESDPNAQVIWIDAENTFDFEWAEKVGIWFEALCTKDPETGKLIDRNRLRVYPINDGKQIFRRISGEAKADKFGNLKKTPGLLDMVLAGILKCPLIVIDSLAAIIPPGEDVSAIGKQNMALLPRFLPVEFRRLSVPLTKADVCLLCINQVTTNIGDQFADKFSFSGGEKLKHWLSLNIFIDKMNAKEGKILTAKDDLESSIGQEVKFIIKKSKFGPYPRSCRCKVCFQAGTEYTGKAYDKIGIVDLEEEWIELGLHYNIIKRGGPWYTFGENKYMGVDKFVEAIKEDSSILETIQAEIIKAKNQGAKNDMHLEDEEQIVATLEQLENDNFADENQEE
jgi:recombination protein RecA